MNKTILVILALMLLSLAGCSSTDTQTHSNVTSNGTNHPTSVSNGQTANTSR